MIQPLLPNKPRGVPRIDGRLVLNGISTSFAQAHPGSMFLSAKACRRQYSIATAPRGLTQCRDFTYETGESVQTNGTSSFNPSRREAINAITSHFSGMQYRPRQLNLIRQPEIESRLNQEQGTTRSTAMPINCQTAYLRESRSGSLPQHSLHQMHRLFAYSVLFVTSPDILCGVLAINHNGRRQTIMWAQVLSKVSVQCDRPSFRKNDNSTFKVFRTPAAKVRYCPVEAYRKIGRNA